MTVLLDGFGNYNNMVDIQRMNDKSRCAKKKHHQFVIDQISPLKITLLLHSDAQ